MANDNVIGLSMSLDVTDLKSGIKEVNSVIKKSKDEFNNATAGMDKWTNSSEGLNAKLKQLNTQLDAQNKAVKGYEAEIKRVSELEGDHSVQLEQLKSKLAKAQAEVKKTESATSHYKDTLSEVTKKEKEENSTLGKLQKTITEQKNKQSDLTKEYKNAVLQYGKNSTEAKALSKELNNVSKELEKNEKKIKSSENAFESLGKSIGDSATKALEKSVKTFAKVGVAVGGLVGSFLATAEATREFRTNMAKVDTAFDEAGLSAKDAEKTYTEFYGILGDEGQATEAVSHLAKLATNQKDLSKWTNIAAGVYGTFGDSLPIENLTEASNETAKTGQLTGGLADALNWAGKSEDEFQKSLDRCNSESERQALITKTLNDLYGEASKKYKENNKDVIASQEAQAKLSQAMADIGSQAEPLLTQLKLMGAELAEKMLPVIKNIVDFVQNNMPLVVATVGTLTTVIGGLGAVVAATKIKVAALTVAQNAQKVALVASTVATKAATAAQWLLNTALLANPIGIIIAAITALVAAFVVLWKKSDAFREFWKKLWDGIKKVTKTVVDAIGNFFKMCWDGIKSAWNKAADFFKNIFNVIVNTFKNIPVKIKESFSKAWDAITNVFSNIGSFFKNIISKIVTTFKELPSKMLNIGKNIVEGLWNGINKAKDWIIGKIKGFADKVVGGIKKFFGVHSPSTVTAEIGGYMAEGLAEGIEDNADKVIDAGNKAGQGFIEGVEEGAKKGNLNYFDELNETIDNQKEKLSKLESQYKSAVATFGATSTEAFNVGRQMMTLTREIDANELKVKDLNDSYKNLSGTLANQMRIELNNSKNKLEALKKQQEATTKALNEATRNRDFSMARNIKAELLLIDKEFENTKATVQELTDNLDYMNKKQKEAAANATAATVIKNEYEKLKDTIAKQKEELEKLRTSYESVLMTQDESSEKAQKLATQIKNLTKEIAQNENKVDELDEAYNRLNKTSLPEIAPKTSKLEQFINNSKERLAEWKIGIGGLLGEVTNDFEKMFSKVSEFTSAILNKYNQQTDDRIKLIERELDAFTSAKDEELKLAETSANTELKNVEKMFDNMEISAIDYKKQKTKIENELAKQQKKINDDKAKQEKKLAKEKDDLARRQFNANQSNSLAEALIQGALAIVKGFAELGPIGGAINAAVQAGITGVQVAAIKSQKYVPMLAKGGIVDGATLAMVGENGKEAIMPLENNTSWIKQLAEQLSNIMNKDLLNGLQLQPAYAMANGETIINNYYTQTINSPKQLSRREIYRDSKNLLALKG